MGFTVWDIDQSMKAYRQKKQGLHVNPPPPILDGFSPSESLALPCLKQSHHVTSTFDADFFTTLEKELPPVFTRQLASQKTGGLISAKTLSNLDSLNRGPSVKVRIGSKVGYERANFLQWLRGRMKW